MRDGKPVGSALIGQNFSDPKHFWGRPSATGADALQRRWPPAASNQGPLNPALADAVKARIEALRAADPGNTAPVPVDLVTASASGLDPHISAGRGALPDRARGARRAACRPQALEALIARHTEGPLAGASSASRASTCWR